MCSVVGVFKQQSHKTIVYFEGVEKLPILVVLEPYPKFLVPQHPVVTNYVDQFQKKRVPYDVVHESNGTNQLGVSPLGWVGVRYV